MVEIINHILNAEYKFTKYQYIIDYQFEKTKTLLDQAGELLKEMESLPYSPQGFEQRMQISKKVDALHKKVDRIEKAIMMGQEE